MPPPRLKRSNTASAAPASLEDGEIAINQADGKLYYRTVAGGVSTFTSTPTAHKSTHATGGSDALSAADIGALTQATADTRYVNVTGDTMTGGLAINAATPLSVTGGRTFLAADSEPYGLGVRYVSSGGAVYFGATDGTATPGVQISKAGGGALMSWTNAGAASIPGTLTVGGTAVVVSSDSRLSDARTPTSHAHGNISNAGAIGTTAQLPIITTTSGVLTTGAFGTTSGSFCQGNDGRLSDARTPLAHTQAASTITDFATEAAKYGPVTSVNGLTGAVTISAGTSISDGNKGDITVSGSGATWTINANAVITADIAGSAVTYAKIQNVSATDRLLGRSTAGAGVVEEIACTSAGRALLDDADAAAQRTTLGLGSIATQASNAVAVTGGTINGASIGATTASTGAFTSLTASSDVGIGVATGGTVRLNVYQNPTNQNGYVTHQVFAEPVSTSNGAHAHFAGYFLLRTDVAAGVTNSGAHRGCFVSSLRNNKATNNTDAGTLGFLRGAEIQYGHGAQNTSNTPTTTSVTGLHLGPQAGYGTITDMYDLYIAAPNLNLGTVGNHWALYQAGSAQKSYFAGRVGIGTTTPGSKLEVIPGGGQGINCLNNGGAGTVNYALMGQAAGTAAANTGVYVNAYGATSNYGVRIVNPPAAANSWAIYSDATAQSYFAGRVGIGTTAPAVQLDVVGAVRASTGILFGTDTATANTLSDYEEGTWTPTFTASTTNPTVTYAVETAASYTKIGRLVYATAFIQLSALSSSGAGDLRISGLPFAPLSSLATWHNAGAIGLCANWVASAPERVLTEPGTAYIALLRLGDVNFQTNTTARDSNVPASRLTSSSLIALTITYQT